MTELPLCSLSRLHIACRKVPPRRRLPRSNPRASMSSIRKRGWPMCSRASTNTACETSMPSCRGTGKNLPPPSPSPSPPYAANLPRPECLRPRPDAHRTSKRRIESMNSTREDQPRQPNFGKAAYRKPNEVGRLIDRLDQYRCIVTRSEKRAATISLWSRSTSPCHGPNTCVQVYSHETTRRRP